MAFSITALQLVNQVREMRRLQPVNNFSETEDVAARNALNNAIDEVLEEKRWDWNVRHDGQLTTRARLTDPTFTTNSGDMTLGITRSAGLAEADIRGDYMIRALMTGSSGYADTSMRIISTGPIFGGILATADLSTSFPETNASGIAGELQYSDYALPDTVESVVRVTYEDDDLTLHQVDPVLGFTEEQPRRHSEYGDPELVTVGSFAIPTYDNSATAPEPALVMSVWPVPEEAYVINYSYYYRHPELVETTDTLEGVPPGITSRIVQLAAADMKAYYEKDEMGFQMRDRTERSIRDKHDTHSSRRAARKGWRGWGASRTQGNRSDPFRGRTVGG